MVRIWGFPSPRGLDPEALPQVPRALRRRLPRHRLPPRQRVPLHAPSRLLCRVLLLCKYVSLTRGVPLYFIPFVNHINEPLRVYMEKEGQRDNTFIFVMGFCKNN